MGVSGSCRGGYGMLSNVLYKILQWLFPTWFGEHQNKKNQNQPKQFVKAIKPAKTVKALEPKLTEPKDESKKQKSKNKKKFLEYSEDSDDDESKGEKGLPAWVIPVAVVGGLLTIVCCLLMISA